MGQLFALLPERDRVYSRSYRLFGVCDGYVGCHREAKFYRRGSDSVRVSGCFPRGVVVGLVSKSITILVCT